VIGLSIKPVAKRVQNLCRHAKGSRLCFRKGVITAHYPDSRPIRHEDDRARTPWEEILGDAHKIFDAIFDVGFSKAWTPLLNQRGSIVLGAFTFLRTARSHALTRGQPPSRIWIPLAQSSTAPRTRERQRSTAGRKDSMAALSARLADMRIQA